jgi:hypothetical protein
MTKNEVRVLADWVRVGGFLITIPGAGQYDELGRERARPLLVEALALNADVREPQRFGKGKVVVADPERFGGAVQAATRSFSVPFTLPAGIEIVCYQTPNRHVIHLLRHDDSNDPVSVWFPSWLGARPGPAEWFSPDWVASKVLAIEQVGHSVGLRFPGLPPYSVIAFRR